MDKFCPCFSDVDREVLEWVCNVFWKEQLPSDISTEVRKLNIIKSANPFERNIKYVIFIHAIQMLFWFFL
jgi:hypothetical protein